MTYRPPAGAARARQGARRPAPPRRGLACSLWEDERRTAADAPPPAKAAHFPCHHLSWAMTNELDNSFASLPTDSARKRKRTTTDTTKKGTESAPPAKRSGVSSSDVHKDTQSTTRPRASTSISDAQRASSHTTTQASTAQAKVDAPPRRVPVVVHDTSASARAAPPAQARSRPTNDEDAAFADSRGRDRMYLLLTQANAPKRVFASLPRRSFGSTRVAVR